MMRDCQVEAVASSTAVQVIRVVQKSEAPHLDQDPEAGKRIIDPTTCDVPRGICVEEVWLVDRQYPLVVCGMH